MYTVVQLPVRNAVSVRFLFLDYLSSIIMEHNGDSKLNRVKLASHEEPEGRYQLLGTLSDRAIGRLERNSFQLSNVHNVVNSFFMDIRKIIEEKMSVCRLGHQYTLCPCRAADILTRGSFIAVYNLRNNRVTKRRFGVNSVIS